MKNILTILSIVWTFGANAQTIDDILRVSYQSYEGTARFSAMGGAFGALGGDVSSFAVNPAGLAIFRKSHASITSSLTHVDNVSDVGGIQTNDYRLHPGISSLGLALVFDDEGSVKWNFGLTYMKKTDFSRRTSVGNVLNEKSIIDYFVDKANGDKDFFVPDGFTHNAFYDYNPLDWDVVMAYRTYLIDWDGESYFGALNEGDRVHQHLDYVSRGSSGEFTFDIGLNYNDKLYAGILFGMTTLKHRHDVIYKESAHLDNTSDFDLLTYNTGMTISGLGLNCKIGVIYKPIHFVRLGFAFHSPDNYIYPYRSSEDEDAPPLMDNFYSSSLEANYRTSEAPFTDGSDGTYYMSVERIRTPYKAIGSIAFVAGKYGLISFDCEYVDYSRIKLKGISPVDRFNSDIKEYFKSTLNFRLGAEVWIRNIALRAGYIYNQSPDKSYNLSRTTYSVGLGYRISRHLNFDLAYIQTNSTDYYTHYVGASTITEHLTSRRLSLTLGWTFDYNSF
jgi:hypothetical protein